LKAGGSKAKGKKMISPLWTRVIDFGNYDPRFDTIRKFDEDFAEYLEELENDLTQSNENWSLLYSSADFKKVN